MSDLFSIGSAGVTAYQRALSVVSNNIANVSTDGYARQNVSLVSNSAAQYGAVYLGTGARFESVRRQYDAFVEQNLRNASADVKSQEPMLTYTNRLIDVMADESIGLTSSMNLFFESARNLATDPASLVARGTFLRDADGLAARFRQMASQMDLVDKETLQATTTGVDQVNAYAKQLAYVNRQLAKHNTESKQPAELLDQRDLLLRRMSELINFNTKFEPNGSVLVSVGDTINQGVLVDGTTQRDLGVVDSPNEVGKLSFLVDPYGTQESVSSITSGQLGGLVNFRDQVLTPTHGFLDDVAQIFVDQVNAVHHNGLDMDGLVGGDMFQIDPSVGGAAGMKLVLQDVTKIAVAGDFRVSDDPLNTGLAQARIAYVAPDLATPPALSSVLDSGLSDDYLTPVQVSDGVPARPIGVISAGQSDVSVYLDDAQTGQWLQLITRDGRHLVGNTEGGAASSLLTTSNFGLEAGATYSDAYLNQSYLGMDIVFGARGVPQAIQNFDSSNGAVLPPTITAAQLTAEHPVDTTQSVNWAAGTFTLNGVSMPAFSGALSDETAVVDWINNAGAGVTATVVNGHLSLSRDASNTTDDIRLALGSGAPADLAALGFRTGIHVVGEAKDDLIFAVSDTTNPGINTTPQVLASIGALTSSPKDVLRSQELTITFQTTTSYTITDTATGSVLAERPFDNTSSSTVIDFRGVTIELSSPPNAGDKFVIDGNQDGVGNNEAMLKIANLEDDASLMGNGLTMTETYIERVNNIGSQARQTNIAQQALDVVYQQALQTREAVSGVSIDQEAADLVRYQQAYQANAKVMQVGSTLFDAILQVR